MLPSVEVLYEQLLALPEEIDDHQACVNFINVVADFMNQVQAGPNGTPGIFTYNRPPAVAMLETQEPVLDYSWVIHFADSIETGVLQGTITPGTVTDSAWVTSTTDTVTSTSITATITTLAAAKALLISELYGVNWYTDPPRPLAQAIHDYATTFMFLCIGIGAPPALPHISILFPAE